MPKEQKSFPTINLWEQWLQRINIGPDPEAINNHRIELLHFVLQNRVTNDQFYCRFGTILVHSIFAELVVVYKIDEQKTKQILFTNALKRESQSILGHLNLLDKSDHKYSQQKNNLRLTVNRHSQPIRYQYQWLLDEDKKVGLFIGSRVTLEILDVEFLHIIRDIISNKLNLQNTETTLFQEKDRFNSLTHQLSEGLVVINSNFLVELWNRPITLITGYKSKETILKPVEDFIKRKDEKNWISKIIEDCTKSKQDYFSTEFEIQPQNCTSRWVSVSGSVVRKKDRTIDQIFLLIRDISKIKELEKQKNDFISIATHELRTPITAIKGYLNFLLRDSSNLSEKQLRYLDRAITATERLVNLSEELLEVVRIQQNRHQFVLRQTLIKPITDKLVADFSLRAKDKKIQLSVKDFDPNLSAVADPTRLEQVLANIVDNAIKYTKKGSIEISVHKSSLINKPAVTINVKDSGIGMSQSEIENVFNKFHRTESAEKTGETGAGIGLYIVRTFIEKMLGRVIITSKPNKGTTCSVQLLLAVEKES